MIKFTSRSLCFTLLFLLVPVWTWADNYSLAQAALENNHDIDASKLLQAWLEDHPNHYQAWFTYGVALSRQREFYRAIDAFRRVTSLNPELAESHNNLAVIYNELGDYHAAIQELEISLKKKPGFSTAYENLGDIYIKLALHNYQKALKSDANNKGSNGHLYSKYMQLLRDRDSSTALTEIDEQSKAKP
ncbi:MAG: tetratricopeptide repeat protein [Mariprofundaceae bacterium]